MKTIYIKDLQKNQIISNETFAIFECETAQDKNGKDYLKLLIGDKTGKVQAKMWNDNLQKIDKKIIKVGNLVSLSAKVEEYQGKIQLNILDAVAVDETALESFIQSSQFDADEMMAELMTEIDSIENNQLREVLKKIFTDKDINRKFKYSTAAKVVHHDFRSGLLQHVLEMLAFSKPLKRFYPQLNYDVLTAGIIMHDIGKIVELDGLNLSTTYTKEGILFGHITLGLKIFEDFGGKDLPKDLYLAVAHLILSHHGSLEFGSPVLPSTLEAIVLTHLDNLSAKTRSATQIIAEIPGDKDFSNSVLWLGNARMWKGPDLALLNISNFDTASNQATMTSADSNITENKVHTESSETKTEVEVKQTEIKSTETTTTESNEEELSLF